VRPDSSFRKFTPCFDLLPKRPEPSPLKDLLPYRPSHPSIRRIVIKMKSPHKSPSKDRRQTLDSHLPLLPLYSSLTIESSKYVIQTRPCQTVLAQLGREDTLPRISILDPVSKVLVVNLVVLKLLLELLHLLRLPRLLIHLLERLHIHLLLLHFLKPQS
jgi:hypothetical protein